MTNPGEIANDMAAQDAYWVRREEKVGRACLEAARVIRAFLSGEKVYGRTYYGLHRRLLDLETRYTGDLTFPNFTRAPETLSLCSPETKKPRPKARQSAKSTTISAATGKASGAHPPPWRISEVRRGCDCNSLKRQTRRNEAGDTIGQRDGDRPTAACVRGPRLNNGFLR